MTYRKILFFCVFLLAISGLPAACGPADIPVYVPASTWTPEHVLPLTADLSAETVTPFPPMETPQPTLALVSSVTPNTNQTLAVAIATRMVSQPSQTPLPACKVHVTEGDVPFYDEPIVNVNRSQGTLFAGESYDILAWHPPALYIGNNGFPKGWVTIPRPGLELAGTGCVFEGYADLEFLYGFPNVCLFIAVEGVSSPMVYPEPSINSTAPLMFQTAIGYYLREEGDFYAVTMSGSGPSGYVLKSSGQLVGDCD